ncbi:CvfB family protein [Oleiharenicola lentus]|uniref:CvfB family protein n=1 Tax=Oleiharenicola lentus TaxID=2508720 RepID=UPI003F66D69F
MTNALGCFEPRIWLPFPAGRVHRDLHMAQLGKRNSLLVLRAAQPGLYLDGGAHGEILLPSKYIRAGDIPGKTMDVFVYRDSEDRLVATTEKPKAYVDEFAYLKVVGMNRRVGIFLDWGLEKDLLLPLREIKGPLDVGTFVLVQIVLDVSSDRLIASARLKKRLDLTPPPYEPGEAVRLLVSGQSPLGYNFIINHAHTGLIYEREVTTPLKVGDFVEGYVRNIRPDGKIDLALGRAGYRRIEGASDIILEKLKAAKDGRLPFNDNSLPEEIRDAFGLSKKAFKQAIGALFKARLIHIEGDGIYLAERGNEES